MAQIGHQWEDGSLDVLHEHRASQTCALALYSLKSDLEQSVKAGSPVAVGGGPEGDPYLLANLLAESVLLDAGWQAINLGPHTPIASFRKALKEFRPRLLWLSISFLASPEEFASEYRDLYRDAVRSGTAVAIGGKALTDEVRSVLPYTTYGDRMSHLSAFARSLHPGTRELRDRHPRKR
jgi:methanogenic corrinoid protein MtbC1